MTLDARWWQATEHSEEPAVACDLCPHACIITEGRTGYCKARSNEGGKLVSTYLGRFTSIAVDPIEKKPLYHWRPGTQIFSLGSIGCTMRCPFCQNCGIAQPSEGSLKRLPLKEISIQALVGKCRELGVKAVAYTYNEPALQAEYIITAVPILREAGIATVLVSNGMYSESLLRDLAPVVDAANIDVKSFNADVYAKMGGSLDTVKRTVAGLLDAGVHVEVTTLVVPGISDSPEEFVQETMWLAGISPNIPLHISRYRPAHKFDAPPTDIELLQRFAMMAQLRLKHVHIGNVSYLRV